VIKKLSHLIHPVFDDFPVFDDEQVRLSRLLVAHVTAISESGDVSFIGREAPWLMPAIVGANQHLRRHGFDYGYRLIGKANAIAHRVAAYTSPSLGGFDMGHAATALAWHDKGTAGRDYFFHLAFTVAYATQVNPYDVTFRNALDKNCAHFVPSTLLVDMDRSEENNIARLQELGSSTLTGKV
jgi:hypothetical protein